MTEDGFLAHVSEMAGLLRQRLAGLQDEFADVIEEVRGEGLMLGLKLKAPNAAFVEAARAARSCSRYPPAIMWCESCPP